MNNAQLPQLYPRNSQVHLSVAVLNSIMAIPRLRARAQCIAYTSSSHHQRNDTTLPRTDMIMTERTVPRLDEYMLLFSNNNYMQSRKEMYYTKRIADKQNRNGSMPYLTRILNIFQSHHHTHC
jgi:hypothetical protein